MRPRGSPSLSLQNGRGPPPRSLCRLAPGSPTSTGTRDRSGGVPCPGETVPPGTPGPRQVGLRLCILFLLLLLPCIFLPLLSVLQKPNQGAFAILITESSAREKGQGWPRHAHVVVVGVLGRHCCRKPGDSGAWALPGLTLLTGTVCPGQTPPLSKRITKTPLIHLTSVYSGLLRT